MQSASNSASWDVSAMSLEEKVGQLIMVRYPDRGLLRDMLAQGHAGSFYFSMRGSPVEEVAATLNELQALAKYPQIVAFGFTCTTCGTGLLRGNHMRIGATRSREIAYRLGYLETREQRAYGFHFPGTPVLDVNTNAANPIINTRAFGDDVELVTDLSLEMLRGIIDARGMTCAMHFPGHGATSDDSHIRIPLVAKSFAELWELDLVPYRAALARGLLNGECTNHIHYPAFEPGPPRPATVSRKIVTGLLRETLGYDGVITSDSLTMKPMKDAYGIEESAILTVLAGHDIVLQDYQSPPRITHAALVRAVRDGRIPEQQVDASAARVLRLKEWLGLFEDRFVDIDRIPERVATDEHKAFAMRVARESVTVLENRGLPLPSTQAHTCLVVVNGSGELLNEDMDSAHLPTFARFLTAMRRRDPGVETCTLSEALGSAEIANALSLAEQADTVVFGVFTRVICYHEDSIAVPPAYDDLIRRVAAMNKRLVIVNFGNPYTLASLPRADAALCTYDDACEETPEAAAEALFGEIETRGKLPVRVSAEYPFGHGL